MKKIIAILAMIALVGGVAFAEAAVSGQVIGNVTLATSDDSDATDGKIFGSAGIGRDRITAEGQDEDGKFGAWIRYSNGQPWTIGANAWWKPIDQFLMRIGSNGGDGFYGKEGVTGWGFYQTVSDTGVAFEGDNVWGIGGTGNNIYYDGFTFRNAFYGGFDSNGLMLEIKPAEVFGLNIVLPYFDMAGAEVADIFGSLVLQADVNLDFGNIALTYTGDASDDTNGNVYLYVGIGAIENVAIDIGLGLTIPGDVEGQKLNVGLGAKVDISETFGLKARVVAGIPTDSDKDKTTNVLVDILPFFALSDSMTVFVGIGLGLQDNDGDSMVGFHFNPYLQVGSEWGPKFLAGIKVASVPLNKDDSVIAWSIPIAISVGF